MKKTKKILIIFASVVLFIILIALFIWKNELGTLSSLKEIDEYPMYRMSYIGDYGFDEFLKKGAKSDSDIEDFVIKRLTKGLPIDLNVTNAGCTAFTTRNIDGDVIFARNFDFDYSPSLQLYTNPKDGYASISTVNLSYIGYDRDNLPNNFINKFLLLASPYLPFDGVNEKGVAIALLAVPEADGGYSDKKVTFNTTTAIRLVLDKAKNVNEAIELLKNYNIYFSGDVECHYLIADSTGKSVLVEYYDKDIRIVTVDKDYQIASNFIAYNNLNIGEGYSEFERYNKVEEYINQNKGNLKEDKVLKFMTTIGVYYENNEDALQWTVVYNLNKKNGLISTNRDIKNINYFNLSKNFK